MATTRKTGGMKADKLSKKGGYTEPTDYFPKDIRKKNKLGEYAKKTTKKK